MIKHGEAFNGKITSLYRIWVNMISRTKYPNTPYFKHYGGRGIRVCEEWQSASNFIKWAKTNGYEERLEIDRKNNNGNYTPDNCRFVTHKINCSNRRKKIDKRIENVNYGIYKTVNVYRIYISKNKHTYYGGCTSDILHAQKLREDLLLKINN